VSALTEQAPAKVNLTLRVLGCRADGYHELESLVAFAGPADTLSLQQGSDTALDISGPFAAACDPAAENLVLKAVAALRDRVSGLRAGRFALLKNIPVAGGVGGGSSDAAAALRLLARANGLAPDDARLSSAALAVGADVPVCLDPRPRIMRGVGERLSAPLSIPPLPALLVNPRVPLSTRAVFEALAAMPANGTALDDVPSAADAMVEFLTRHGNDLTPAAIACAPAVAEVLKVLGGLSGVRLARMSGSGPTCFALFATGEEAAAAGRCLQAERPDWWIHATTIG
jgi:4-diphosphocytidyl-2-C-methyl-D-erythritol kinase